MRMMNKCVNYVVVILFCIFCNVYTEDYECPHSQTTCEYSFELKEGSSMVYGGNEVHVRDGQAYINGENGEEAIPNEKVITLDGQKRKVITVNGIIPAPPIIVHEGQKIIVHVHNLMLSETTSIHWHGLHQRGTPGMDGVGFITQCPQGPGQFFTYEFETKQKGTYWYHSHVGTQRTQGFFGALIIKENPSTTNVPITVHAEDRIMIVGDWDFERGEEAFTYIDGRGRMGDDTDAPLTQVNVTSGKAYRFRVVQAGADFPLRVSVDNHKITLIASDGYDVEHEEVESIIMNPGERFDFLLTADKPVDNYWIRALSLDPKHPDNEAQAILHYDGASGEEPSTTRESCTEAKKCEIANCLPMFIPNNEREQYNCILMSDFKNSDIHDPAPAFEAGKSEEHFLNFGFAAGPSINGRAFVMPGVSSLTQDDETVDVDCKPDECGEDKTCSCYSELEIPFDETIQMVWTVMGSSGFSNHPIHLHGHSFYVLKMVAPENPFIPTPDIQCHGNATLNFCNKAGWANPSWENGNVPGLNLINPPRKDTLIVPQRGYAVIRIRSDNPAKWFMHCHIESHALGGMALVVREAYDHMPLTPYGFPICQNFYNDPSKDYQYVRKDAIVYKRRRRLNVYKRRRRLNVNKRTRFGR